MLYPHELEEQRTLQFSEKRSYKYKLYTQFTQNLEKEEILNSYIVTLNLKHGFNTGGQSELLWFLRIGWDLMNLSFFITF